jgi:ABC-type glycerol-3-phosphate transport system substrate-binding protein
MKKWLSVFFIVTFAAASVFAGGGQQKDSGASGASSGGELSGTLKYFEPHYSDPAVKLGVDETIRMFQKLHPKVQFDIQYIPMAERTTKFLAAMMANDGPDVACVGNMGDYRAFVEADYLVEMGDKFISNPSAYWDRFPKSFVDYITIGGKKYGIPYYSGPYAMVYNKKEYAAAGITQMPKTWDEFKAVLKKLTVDTNKDGKIDQYGFTMPTIRETAPRIFSMFAWSNGGAVSRDDLTTVTINSPECVAALEFLTSLVTEGLVPPGIGEADNDAVGELFGSGVAATRMEGNWALATMPIMYPALKDNIGVYPLPGPAGKTPVPLSIIAVYSLTSQTRYVDAGYAFIDFITTDAAQQAYLDLSGYGPVTKTIINANVNDATYGGFIALTNEAKIKPIFKNDTQVDDIIREAMQRAFLRQSTPKQALDLAAEKLQSVIR